jgi:hypothetical protein
MSERALLHVGLDLEAYDHLREVKGVSMPFGRLAELVVALRCAVC